MHNVSLPGSISAKQSILILLFLLLGGVAAFQIPYGAGFDEEQHLRRMWEMSALVLKPNSALGPGMPIPSSFSDLSYRNFEIIRPVPQPINSKIAEISLGETGYIYDDARTRSIYSPLVLGPQSLSVRYLGRKYQASFFWVLITARMIGLVVYAGLIYLAIRLIPFGKWTFLILALTPTALFQAATLSADTLTNGIGFLFIAGSLAIARREHIGIRYFAWMVGLFTLLFAVKVNIAALGLLPFLLLKPRDFEKKGGYWGLLMVAAFLFTLEIGGWYSLTASADTPNPGQAQPFEQLLFLVKNPLFFLSGMAGDLAENGLAYLSGLFAGYGYYYWTVPALVYPLVAAALLASMLIPQENAAGQGPRFAMLSVFVLSYVATAALLQMTGEPVGSRSIHELHGRYFTPLIPLLFLAMIGAPTLPVVSETRLTQIAFTFGLMSLIVFIVGLYLSYHVPCGSSYYSFGRCYQPQYKNWAPDQNPLGPLDEVGKVQQSFTAECDRLSSVRIWSSSATQFESGTMQLELIDHDEQIMSFSMDSQEAPISGWLSYEFPPIEGSEGDEFVLSLQASGQPNGQGIRLGQTEKAEYGAGELVVEDQGMSTDLFFQYGCSTGLLTLLPDQDLQSIGSTQ